jgi:tRNA1Val (adenine37-N6)-methyltransferase
MKVGTDGLLLGAWTPVNGCTTVLDIGTGTGMVALMLAQRNKMARITGVEIDEEAAAQARTNALSCPFSERLQIICSDIRRFKHPHGFELITANPPFFNADTRSPEPTRALARQSAYLPISDLFTAVGRLLDPKGVFSLIYPAQYLDEIISVATNAGLYLQHQTNVHPLPNAYPNRILLLFGREKNSPSHSSLTIRSTGTEYHQDYIDLCKDFLTIF